MYRQEHIVSERRGDAVQGTNSNIPYVSLRRAGHVDELGKQAAWIWHNTQSAHSWHATRISIANARLRTVRHDALSKQMMAHAIPALS